MKDSIKKTWEDLRSPVGFKSCYNCVFFGSCDHWNDCRSRLGIINNKIKVSYWKWNGVDD